MWLSHRNGCADPGMGSFATNPHGAASLRAHADEGDIALPGLSVLARLPDGRQVTLANIVVRSDQNVGQRFGPPDFR